MDHDNSSPTGALGSRPRLTPDLERIAAFCEQTARDGILPSLAWFDETAKTLRAASVGDSPQREKGWVIERHIHSQLHYWTGRPNHWSTKHHDALRFARETDAALMLTYHCEGNGNVVEHLWTTT